ncbi:DUF2142 domain-containing protein [Faecalibacillus intestinalis]|uniref:DUF2142 domain-containing protein n=1 Tax=Faecalibacillus intestinalis TaxID=1982626 RepID=UPI0035202CB3
MKHAKGAYKIEEYQDDLEYVDDHMVEKETRSGLRLLKLLINVLIIFIIIYLYNRYISSVDQLPQSVGNIIYFIFIISSIYLITATNYLLQSEKYKLEKLFLIVMVPVSISYSLIMIPGMVPDEATHMRLTYSLASQIMGVEQDKITLRGEEKYIYDRLPTAPNMDSYDYSYSHFFSGEDNGEYVTIDADSANWKQIFGYFPAVIGVIFSRIMHFGATPTIYIARLCNLFFYLWLTYFAIKKIPIGKQLMFMIAILPMCSQQMMSLSYDAVLNASTFFCLAFGLFFVYNSEDVKFDEYIKYLFSAILILSIKSSIYSFILLIPLLSKFKNLDNNIKIERKQKVILLLSISIFILVLNFVSFGSNVAKETAETAATTKNIISWSGTEGYTIGWLITHPIQGIALFMKTINIKGEWYYYSCLGQDLSWFTVKLPLEIFKIWGLLLLVCALKKEDNQLDKRMRVLFIMINLIIFFLVLLSMCIYWTPLTFDYIEGVQGRYFIPIVFTILIVINNNKINIKENMYRYINVFACLLTVITIMNLIGVCFTNSIAIG